MSKASMPELLRLFAAKAEEWCNATDTEDAWRIECEAVEAFREAFATAAQEQAEPGADERAAFENWMRANRYDVGTFASGEYHNMFARNAWMGWQARAAQSGQRAANLSEATIQALWDEACNDSPQNPGWSRHIRFARAIEQAGQRAGVDAVEIMRICRLFLDEKEGDYDAKACFTAIFKIAAAAPTQQQEG